MDKQTERLISASVSAQPELAIQAMQEGGNPFWKDQNGHSGFAQLASWSSMMVENNRPEGLPVRLKNAMGYMCALPLEEGSHEVFKETALNIEREAGYKTGLKNMLNEKAQGQKINLSEDLINHLDKEEEGPEFIRQSLRASESWKDFQKNMTSSEQKEFELGLTRARENGQLKAAAEMLAHTLTEDGQVMVGAKKGPKGPAPSPQQTKKEDEYEYENASKSWAEEAKGFQSSGGQEQKEDLGVSAPRLTMASVRLSVNAHRGKPYEEAPNVDRQGPEYPEQRKGPTFYNNNA